MRWGRRTGRSHEWSSGEDGHWNTALLVAPEVGKGAAHERHRGREGDTVDGTAYQQGLNVLRDRTGDDENPR